MSLPIIQYIGTFDDPNYWMGYKIIMSDGSKNITCKIENDAKCICERWGMYTKSKLNEFVGAEYQNIYISDVNYTEGPRDDMAMLNIKICTNRGDIIIHFYNEHNGFYKHDVFIQSELGNTTIAL